MNNSPVSPTFTKYTKDDILDYLENPYQYQDNLRDAVIYMYGSSSHFRRLIKYFVGLTDLAYVIAPVGVDANVDVEKLKESYIEVAKFIDNMNLKSQCPTILTRCFREDTAYITTWIEDGAITFQHLPSKYCTISSTQDNVCNVTFDFSYFRGSYNKYLQYYPQEFQTKYNAFLNDNSLRYQDLDVPNSFAIKVNKDTLEYSLPPFSGVLPSYYDLSDYNSLKLTKTELENYAMLVMQLGLDDNGNWSLDFDKAKDFYKNLDNVLPDAIGSILSPMPISKISFEKSGGTSTTDTISEAENHAWRAAGVNASLFTETSSSSAIKLSVISDQSMTFEVVKSIEDAINRILSYQDFGYEFKLVFLNSSQYNYNELAGVFKDGATLGMPTALMWSAVMGLTPLDFMGMQYLEQDILNLAGSLIPLQSSYTQSSDSGDVGRPAQETLDTAGEATELNDSNADKQLN